MEKSEKSIEKINRKGNKMNNGSIAICNNNRNKNFFEDIRREAEMQDTTIISILKNCFYEKYIKYGRDEKVKKTTIIQKDKEGKIIRTYKKIIDIVRENEGYRASNISSAIKFGYYAYGYYWERG